MYVPPERVIMYISMTSLLYRKSKKKTLIKCEIIVMNEWIIKKNK